MNRPRDPKRKIPSASKRKRSTDIKDDPEWQGLLMEMSGKTSVNVARLFQRVKLLEEKVETLAKAVEMAQAREDRDDG